LVVVFLYYFSDGIETLIRFFRIMTRTSCLWTAKQ